APASAATVAAGQVSAAAQARATAARTAAQATASANAAASKAAAAATMAAAKARYLIIVQPSQDAEARFDAQAATLDGFGTLVNAQAWATNLASTIQQRNYGLTTWTWTPTVLLAVQNMVSADIPMINDLGNIVVSTHPYSNGLTPLGIDTKTAKTAANVVRAAL